MNLKTARILTGVYFALATLSMTWPGILPFARVKPLILGLPFSLAWIAVWISGSIVVLYLLDTVERRYRDGGDD